MNLSKSFMLLLVGATLVQACGNKDNTERKESRTSVEVQTVKSASVAKTYEYSGSVASVKKSTLSTRIMGQVDKVFVHEGDIVEKGQLLMAIRSNDIMAKKSQVEANILEVTAAYNNAETDFNRISSLYESKSATKKELDDISTHYQMMKAKLKAVNKAKAEVEEMMTYANIRAPYSGVLTNRFIDAGDMANPGMPLLAIEAPSMFEVITRIPESEIQLIDKGDTVMVALKNCSEDVLGVITRVSSSSRLSGAQFETRVQLHPTAKQSQALRSGMFAQVKLSKGSDTKIMIAKELIINRGQLTGVWTVGESEAALLRWVRLGKTQNNQVEILSGLSEGDQLIVQCKERLHDGMAIQL
ncbi:efflux RND transporter periplasmic adaptor subunit [Labilibacter marinus]|uniref:efflux RND transporter periplasmic adaptor subunit n=1 Tax=Labilibacter marinus TaxID=1477105 RepID=UPI00094F8159|nr:efflux RND transporter periplasmic adaptor subunit [Labilibacter marinus]